MAEENDLRQQGLRGRFCLEVPTACHDTGSQAPDGGAVGSTLLTAFLTTGMCVAAVGAWYVLRGVHRAEARVMLHWGLGLVAALIAIQLIFGHLTGLCVLEHQPAKFAAIEARWKTQQPASEVLLAIPDEAGERNLLKSPSSVALSPLAIGPRARSGWKQTF
jgi:cytochrome bd-type quinol oxidase subunit 1